jgi:hypothetical protein
MLSPAMFSPILGAINRKQELMLAPVNHFDLRTIVARVQVLFRAALVRAMDLARAPSPPVAVGHANARQERRGL